MNKQVWRFLCGVLLLSIGDVRSQIFIDVGSHDLQPNTPGQIIEISVSGGTGVQGMNFNVQIADGGTVDGPDITAVDILGTGANPTIFFGNANTPTTVRNDPQIRSLFTTTVSDRVNTSGLLAIITLDTTGWFGGSWALALGNTQEGSTTFPDGLAPGGEYVPTITEGSITVVPEPVSTSVAGVLLLAGGLIWRTRRTRAR